MLLINSANHKSVLLDQDWNTATRNNEDAGAEENARPRVLALVAFDFGRAAGSSTERPCLDVKTSNRPEGERVAQGGVARDTLAMPRHVAHDAMLAFLGGLVEYIVVAGTVGTDAEDPGNIPRELAVVMAEFHLMAGEALARAVDVKLVDGARQHRSRLPTVAVTTRTMTTNSELVD